MKSFAILTFLALMPFSFLKAQNSYTDDLDQDSVDWVYNREHWQSNSSPSIPLENMKKMITEEAKVSSGIFRCYDSKRSENSLERSKSIWFEINFNRGLIAVKLYKDEEIYYGQFNRVHTTATRGGYWPQLTAGQKLNSFVYSTFANTVSTSKVSRFIPAFIGVQKSAQGQIKKIKAVDIDFTLLYENGGALNTGYNLKYCKEVTK